MDLSLLVLSLQVCVRAKCFSNEIIWCHAVHPGAAWLKPHVGMNVNVCVYQNLLLKQTHFRIVYHRLSLKMLKGKFGHKMSTKKKGSFSALKQRWNVVLLITCRGYSAASASEPIMATFHSEGHSSCSYKPAILYIYISVSQSHNTLLPNLVMSRLSQIFQDEAIV